MNRRGKKMGRPALAGGRVKFTTTLPERVVTKLRKLGGGNASQAIIMLVERELANDEHREGWVRSSESTRP